MEMNDLILDQVVELLAYGQIDEAKALATGRPEILQKIDQSTAFLKNIREYENYYSSDMQGPHKRIAGEHLTETYAYQIWSKPYLTAAKLIAAMEKRDSLLDLGCGDGLMIFNLLYHQIIKSAVGIDAWENGISFARVYANKKSFAAKFTRSLFEKFETQDTFDVVFIGEVLEHVVDPIVVLKKAKSFLNPGGRLVTTVPLVRPKISAAERAQLLSGEPIQHVREMTPSKLAQLTTAAGFSLEGHIAAGDHWICLVSVFKLGIV